MPEICPDGASEIESEIRAALKLQSLDPKSMMERTHALLERAETIGSDRCIALACQVLGGGYRRSNDATRAVTYLTRALAHAEEQSTLAAHIHVQLGALANERRDFMNALHHLLIALEIHRELSNKNGIAIAHFNLGNHFQLQHQNLTAREHYTKSIMLYSQSNDEAGILLNLGALGYLARDRGDLKEAEYRFSTAQEILLRLNDHHNHAKLYVERAVVRAAEGELSLAATYLRKAELTAQRMGMPAISYNARLLEAMIAFKEGRDDFFELLSNAASIATQNNITFSVEEIEQIARLVLRSKSSDFMSAVAELLVERESF
jgi:tetratricopeptide (TPR) repeat protein